MPKKPKHAYTGVLPPLSVLKKIPNWRDALDLEGIAGCDESTIQPHAATGVIPKDGLFSAATICFADGSSVPALAEVQSRHVDLIRVYASENEVVFAYIMGEYRWDVDGFMRDLFPKKKKEALFPAMVELHLPWEEDGQRSIYCIARDGRCRPLVVSTHKGFVAYEKA